MDQSEQQQLLPPHQQVVPMTYATSPYQTAPVVASGTPYPPQHQLVYQAQQFPQQQQQQLQAFWAKQLQEVERAVDFKNHSLPLARIKKIMKADEDVRMISAEAPVVFAKACEMFILELTLRSWIHTEENKRRTLQKNDIAAAISRTDVFDFLVDIIPRDELKEEAVGVTKGTVPAGESVPYYYVPQEHAALCASQQPRPPMAFMLQWPHAQSQLQQQPEQQQAEN